MKSFLSWILLIKALYRSDATMGRSELLVLRIVTAGLLLLRRRNDDGLNLRFLRSIRGSVVDIGGLRRLHFQGGGAVRSNWMIRSKRVSTP